MPWILAALALGGGYWWYSSHKGKWLSATQYKDKSGRLWDRYDGADPPAPAGFSDWIRTGTSTAPVRVATPATNSYDAVGKALDNV